MATPVNVDPRSGKTSQDLGDNVALEEENRKKFKRKVRKLKKKLPTEPNARTKSLCGVMYIAHLPHGFYEDQLKGFFSQFGTITRLRLPRSKRTGNVKGYGWIEFEHEEVAKIAASTMNNYLMFNKLLKCKFMARDECPPNLFKGWQKKVQPGKFQRISAHQMNKKKRTDFEKNARKEYKKRYKKMMESLGSLGISYSLKEENLKLGGKTAEPATSLKKKILTSSESNQPTRESRRSKSTAAKSQTPSVGTHDPDSSRNVLMVDSEDEEITFKTPPNTVKVSRRSGVQLQPSKLSSRKKKKKAVDQRSRAKSTTSKERKRRPVVLARPRLVPLAD